MGGEAFKKTDSQCCGNFGLNNFVLLLKSSIANVLNIKPV